MDCRDFIYRDSFYVFYNYQMSFESLAPCFRIINEKCILEQTEETPFKQLAAKIVVKFI